MARLNNEITVYNQSKIETLFNCGHLGPKWFRLKVFGEIWAKISQTDRCPECMIETILNGKFMRCAICGKIILPGDMLYYSSFPKKIIDLGNPNIIFPIKKIPAFAKEISPENFIVCGKNDCLAPNKTELRVWREDFFL